MILTVDNAGTRVSPALDIAFLTDPGRVRNINCDQCLVLDAHSLGDTLDAFLLAADGMGATRRGDTASRMTATLLPEEFRRLLAAHEGRPTRDDLATLLRSASQRANEAVWRAGQQDPDLRGMGTTCIAAAVTGDQAVLCHAGDSRAYLLTNGEFNQLTSDHSMIQEIVPTDDESVELEGRFGTVITRGIGLTRVLDADVIVTPLGHCDTLLLCTDGLTNMLADERIAAILARAESAEAAARDLVAEANAQGGIDNIGVVICRGPEYVPFEYQPRRALPIDRNDAPAGSSKRKNRRRNQRIGALLPIMIIALALLSVALFIVDQQRRVLLRANAQLRQELDQTRSGRPK